MTASEILLAILLLSTVFAFIAVLFKYLALKSEIPNQVQKRYEEWRNTELQAIRQQYQEIAQKEATLQLQQWREELEKGIRKDAIEKSRAVTIGKVTEHVVPFFPNFNHNPKDARFIGTPVDFVVFDGLDEGAIRKITFMEVKTNSSSLSTRERQIRNAIKQQLVEWEELRIAVSTSQKEVLSDDPSSKVILDGLCPRCEKPNRMQAQFCGHCGLSL